MFFKLLEMNDFMNSFIEYICLISIIHKPCSGHKKKTHGV